MHGTFQLFYAKKGRSLQKKKKERKKEKRFLLKIASVTCQTLGTVDTDGSAGSEAAAVVLAAGRKQEAGCHGGTWGGLSPALLSASEGTRKPQLPGCLGRSPQVLPTINPAPQRRPRSECGALRPLNRGNEELMPAPGSGGHEHPGWVAAGVRPGPGVGAGGVAPARTLSPRLHPCPAPAPGPRGGPRADRLSARREMGTLRGTRGFRR